MFKYAVVIWLMPLGWGYLLAHLTKLKKAERPLQLALTVFFTNVIINLYTVFFSHRLLIGASEFNLPFLIVYSLLIIVIALIFTRLLKKVDFFLPLYRKLTVLFLMLGSAVIYYTTWLILHGGYQNLETFIFNLSYPLNTFYADFKFDLITLLLGLSAFTLPIGAIFLNERFSFKPTKNSVKNLTLVLAVTYLFSALTFAYQLLGFSAAYDILFSDDTFIEEHYINPLEFTFAFPNQKKNLIYIISESLEASFFSKELGGNTEVNLLPNLTTWMSKGDSFSHNHLFGGLYAPPTATWSIAGILAQMAGVGLKVPFGGNGFGAYQYFLPGITTLGDILSDAGYQQYMLVGSDSEFAGSKNYFQQHGDFYIFDYFEAQTLGKIPLDYKEFWGFEDLKLFEFAQEIITDAAKNPAPFHVFLELNDMHRPDGYVDQKCPLKAEIAYEHAILCYDYNLNNFLNWLTEQDFYKETVVVILGDHLSMAREYFQAKNYSSNYPRRVFNLILNSQAEKSATEFYVRFASSFDMFPTILASLGVKWEAEKLGLGVNLYANEQTIYETFEPSLINKALSKISRFYNRTFFDFSDKVN